MNGDSRQNHSVRSDGGGDIEYVSHVTKVLRGREASTTATMANQGWELVSETKGVLRTELVFRRVKPKSLGAYLKQGWVDLRGGRSTSQSRAVSGLGAFIFLLVGITLFASLDPDEADTSATTAAQEFTEEPTQEPTAETSEEPSEAPAEEPTEESSEEFAEQPTEGSSEEPAEEPAVLTSKNSKDLAAVLQVSDYCSPRIRGFATEFEGRQLRFDGSISAKAGREYTVSPGDKGSMSVVGPMFKVTGRNSAASVALNDLVRVVATVDNYNSDQCLFFVQAVSVTMR